MAATKGTPGETGQQGRIELEPALLPIAERVLAEFEYAARKAVAHDASPKQYPMPASTGHLEQFMQARLASRPADKRKRAAAQVMPGLSAMAKPLPGVGPQVKVDLRSRTPIAEQIGQAAPKAGFKPDLLVPVVKPNGAAPAASAARAFKGIDLRINKVVCHEETSEWGSDELELAGISIDATGDTRKLERFRVSSDFDSGEQVVYSPPKTFASFNYAADNHITTNGKTLAVTWPRTYYVTFLAAEIDNGGFPDFAYQLYAKVKVAVTAYLAKAVGGYFGGQLGVVIGAAVGKVIGWIMDKLLGVLVRWWEDDAFPPVTSKITVHGPTADLRGRVGGSVTGSALTQLIVGNGGKVGLYGGWALRK